MTNEELLAALSVQFDGINKNFEAVNNRLDRMEARIDKIEERLDNIEERLDNLEEDSAVTREGVNSLLEWADVIGRINRHPIAN